MLMYSKTLYSIYLYSNGLGIFFLALLTFYSFFNFKFFKSNYQYLFYCFVVYFVLELFIYFATKININTPKTLWHFYSIVSIVLPTIFYLKSFNNPLLKNLSIIVIIIFISASFLQIIYSYFFNAKLESPILFPVKNLLAIVLALIFHSKLLKSKKIKSLKSEPSFWFNIGFIFINVSSLVINPLFNAVIPISDDLAFIIGTISQIADPITYTLWAIGVYKLSTQPFRPISSLWP